MSDAAIVDQSENQSQAGSGQSPASSIGDHASDRRKFLRTAAMVGAALCFADVKALRAAAVLARAEGKLVFTEANFNRFIADSFNKPTAIRNQMVAESKANLSAFINKYFTLTSQQSHKLSTLTSSDLNVVRGSIDNAVAHNAPMTVKFNAPAPNVPRPKFVKRRSLDAGRDAMRARAAIKTQGPRGGTEDSDILEATELGKGTTLYAMRYSVKGSISAKANGDVSGSVEVSGSC